MERWSAEQERSRGIVGGVEASDDARSRHDLVPPETTVERGDGRERPRTAPLVVRLRTVYAAACVRAGSVGRAAAGWCRSRHLRLSTPCPSAGAAYKMRVLYTIGIHQRKTERLVQLRGEVGRALIPRSRARKRFLPAAQGSSGRRVWSWIVRRGGRPLD